MTGVATEPTEQPPRRWLRWLLVFLSLSAVVAAVALFLLGSRLDGWARAAFEQRLSAALGANVELDQLELDLLRLAADFRGLRITPGEADAGQIEATLAEGRVRLGSRGLIGLAWRRLHLAELTLTRPRFVVSSVATRPKAGPRPEIRLRIDRLTVRSGELAFVDRTVPLDFRATSLGIAASRGSGGLLGQASLKLALDRPPLAEPLPLAVSGSFRWDGQRVELRGVEATGPGLRLTIDSSLDWGGVLAFRGQGELRADLGQLAPFVETALPPLAGQIVAHFDARRAVEPVQVAGRIELTSGRVGPVTSRRATAELTYSAADNRLRIRDLDAQVLGGRAAGSADLAFGDPGHLELSLAAERLDGRTLLDWVGRPLPFGTRVSGEVELAGDPLDPSQWSGSGQFEAEPDPGGAAAIALGGAGSFELGGGKLQLVAPGATAGAAQLEVGLELELDPRPARGHLTLVGEVEDARQAQRATVMLLDALGQEPNRHLEMPLDGQGRVEARIALGGELAVNLVLDLRSGRWGQQAFDRAVVGFSLTDESIDLDDLELVLGRERLEASGRLLRTPLRIDSLELATHGLDPRPLLTMLTLDPRLNGRLDATVRVRREASGLVGNGRLRLIEGQWVGEHVEELTASIAFRGERMVFENIALQGSSTELVGRAWLDLGGKGAGVDIERSRVQLANLAPIRKRELPVAAALEVSGSLELGPGRRGGTLTLRGDEAEVWGQRLGPTVGRLVLHDESIDAELEGVELGWHARGSWGFYGERTLDLQVELEDVPLTRPEPVPETLAARVSGRLSARGPFDRPQAMTVQGQLSRVDLTIGRRSVRSAGAMPLGLADGVLSLGPLTLQGPGTHLVTTAEYDLGADGLTVDSRGSVDPAFVSAFLPEVRASGTGRVDLRLSGPPRDLSIRGSLALTQGRIRWFALPRTLEQVELRVAFAGSEAQVETFHATLGGGEVAGGGTLRLPGLILEGYRLELAADHVRLSLPEDFEGVYTGDLVLDGDLRSARLTGDVALLRGLYAKDLDVVSLVAYQAREYSPEAAAEEAFELELNVRVRAEDNVWVRNDVARLESHVELELGGTARRPEVTGRIGILEGGRLDFRGVEYRVQSGSLDFVDFEQLNPYITLRATTTVKAYEIQLRIDGTVDSFEYQLTSNPSLAPQDIIALLTTGNTLEELTTGGEGAGAQFTGDLAANYFADALTGRFESQLEKALGLDRIQINPLLLEGQRDPTTRLTLGKEVSDDVFIIVSSNLQDVERLYYQIDWQATPRVRFIARREEDGTVGGEVVYTGRFWWKVPERVRQARRQGGGEADPEAQGGEPRVGSVAIVGVPLDEARQLEDKIPLAAGDPFRRSTMFEGVDRLRRYYIDSGQLKAEVRASTGSTDDDPETVHVLYRIDPGARFQVELVGVKKKEEKRIREALQEVWVESLFEEDLQADSEARIRKYFQERGFYAVDISTTVQPSPAGPQILRFTVDRGKQVVVDRVVVEGAVEVPLERIRKQMLTRSPTFFSRRLLKPAVLEDDVTAVRNLYRDLGYLEVTIEPPAIRLDTRGDRARVTLLIDEGERFGIANVDYGEGLPFSREELTGWSGLEVGDVFSPSALIEAEGDVRSGIDAAGYPDVKVRARVDFEGTRVAVELEIEPGERKRVGQIVVLGNELTKERVILRELELVPGDAISRGKLLRSQHRLYQMGIFRSVRIDYEPIQEGSDLQRVEVEVEESKPYGVLAGGGYDTEGNPRVTFSLTNENVGGRGQVLSFQGRFSPVLKRLQFVGEDRRLFGQKLPSLMNLSWEERERAGFTAREWAGALRVDRRFGERWAGFLRYGLKNVELLEVEDALAPGEERIEDTRLGDLGATFLRNTRDDPFLTNQGSLFSVSNQLFAKLLLSEEQFLKTTLSAARWWPTSGNLTLAASVRVGFELPYGETEIVPLSERFFLGGAGSLRGFDLDQVGPKIDGVPVGGESVFVLQGELRVPLWPSLRLKGVGFYDAGNVYLTASDFDPLDLRHVVGLGLRLETPIGPIRFEYGYKLDRQPGESPGEFNLAIGEPF